MDINSVIRVVEGHADTLASKWLERVRSEEDMFGYLREPEERLLNHVAKAYREIGLYLDQPAHQVIVEHFKETGRRRRKKEVPLAQVVLAVQIARNVLWRYVVDQGIFDSTANLYQALNLYREIVKLFDRAVLYTIEGYFES